MRRAKLLPLKRKLKKLIMLKSKWPEEWHKEFGLSRGPLAKLAHQAHELQMYMFLQNQKEGWLHLREDNCVISERPREMADRAYELDDDYY